IRWPALECDNIWLLPGIPDYFRLKLEVMKEHLPSGTQIYAQELEVPREEFSIKEGIDQIVAGHGDVEIGSYPFRHQGESWTRLTFEGTSSNAVSAAKQAAADLLISW
ncbi:MAG: hypothetical protein MK135_17540, partial [Polyangiaceae bacterium]|nr:hypothetical protein [Polyangiaceae bacterium]